jgi:gamma-glutamyltranspeptidase / glutathione hydrolase
VRGGLIQPQAHAQLLLNLIVFGMEPQEAIDAPRFAHVSDLRVWLERPFGEEVRAALGARGHEVGELPVRFAGGAQLVMRLERGWAAASEPRRDGHEAGH